MRRHWRRFRAAVRRPRTDAATTLKRAEQYLDALLSEVSGRRTVYVEQLRPIIDEQTRRVAVNPRAEEWCALLLLHAPVAAKAQHYMDKHPNVREARGRLYELIDFNDTFVSTVLALSPDERNGFLEALQPALERFCKRVGVQRLSDEQFEAITRGLTREIAVYLGALSEGYDVEMTNRTQDALGVDMVITDPHTGERLNIDCKTPSAFRYRIQDLVREGRLSHQEAEQADLAGYAHERNGHGREAVAVTILRVDPNETGDIKNFAFTEPRLLGERLHELFAS
jgi:hypothetical protein